MLPPAVIAPITLLRYHLFHLASLAHLDSSPLYTVEATSSAVPIRRLRAVRTYCGHFLGRAGRTRYHPPSFPWTRCLHRATLPRRIIFSVVVPPSLPSVPIAACFLSPSPVDLLRTLPVTKVSAPSTAPSLRFSQGLDAVHNCVLPSRDVASLGRAVRIQRG